MRKGVPCGRERRDFEYVLVGCEEVASENLVFALICGGEYLLTCVGIKFATLGNSRLGTLRILNRHVVFPR